MNNDGILHDTLETIKAVRELEQKGKHLHVPAKSNPKKPSSSDDGLEQEEIVCTSGPRIHRDRDDLDVKIDDEEQKQDIPGMSTLAGNILGRYDSMKSIQSTVSKVKYVNL